MHGLNRDQKLRTNDARHGEVSDAQVAGEDISFSAPDRSKVHFGIFKIVHGNVIVDAHLAALLFTKKTTQTVVEPSQIARALDSRSLRAVVRWLYNSKWLAGNGGALHGGKCRALQTSLVVVLNPELSHPGGDRRTRETRAGARYFAGSEIRIRLQISSVRPSRPAFHAAAAAASHKTPRQHAHVFFEGTWLLESSAVAEVGRGPASNTWEAFATRSGVVSGPVRDAERQSMGFISKQQERSRGEFLRRMSHELRTPLHAISGVAQMLADEQLKFQSEGSRHDGSMNIRMLLEQLFQASGQMEELIEQLLDFCYTRAASISPVWERFELSNVLLQSWQQSFQRSEEKRVSFVYESNVKEGVFVLGDWRLLTQFIQHQLSNAVKFTSRGQIVFEVKMETISQEYIQLSLRVKDTGIGIQKGDLDRLFSAFEQADIGDTRAFGGAGLGLFLCEQIAVSLGSHLFLTSEPGFSTCFCSVLKLKLAVERERAGGTAAPSHAVVPAGSASASKRLSHVSGVSAHVAGDTAADVATSKQEHIIRILAVDDNEFNLRLLRAFLKDYNCTVTLAQDGADALREFSSMAFDVIFMDLQMPNIDGYEATRQIRRIERAHGRPRTIVTAVSASCFSEDIEKARRAGCDDHIAKPLHRNDIVNALAQYGFRLEKKQPDLALADAEKESSLSESSVTSSCSFRAQSEGD